MLKWSGIIWSMSLVLVITGCTNNVLMWRSEKLVAQMYRQYKHEILLAYNDLNTDILVDDQHGYERAYFDNYRKQIIFTRYRTNEYWIDGRQFTTAEDGIGGYVSEVLVNEHYQIGVEILNITADEVGKDIFDGTKSRIIDLNTEKSITVPGLLFNRNLIVGHYFYGFTFDEAGNRYFDMIDLRTMEHRRQQSAAEKDNITFLYQQGQQVYGQSEHTKQAFLIDGLELFAQPENYNSQLPIFDGGTAVLKDISPLDLSEHWYIHEPEGKSVIEEVQFIRIMGDEIKISWIKLNRSDVIGLRDVSNFGIDKLALYLATESADGEVHAIISIFDLFGKEIRSQDITEIKGSDVGQFTYLDYVE